jgi:hypothetical protein
MAQGSVQLLGETKVEYFDVAWTRETGMEVLVSREFQTK